MKMDTKLDMNMDTDICRHEDAQGRGHEYGH